MHRLALTRKSRRAVEEHTTRKHDAGRELAASLTSGKAVTTLTARSDPRDDDVITFGEIRHARANFNYDT
jgi:hypothetical protein